MDEEEFIQVFDLAKEWKIPGYKGCNKYESLDDSAISSLLLTIENFELIPYCASGQVFFFSNQDTDDTSLFLAVAGNEIKFKRSDIKELRDVAPKYIERYLDEPENLRDHDYQRELLARYKLSLYNIKTLEFSRKPLRDTWRQYVKKKER